MAAIVKFCRGVMTDLTTPNPSHHGTKIFWTDFRTLPSGGGPDGLSSMEKLEAAITGQGRAVAHQTRFGRSTQRSTAKSNRGDHAGIMPEPLTYVSEQILR